MVNTLSNTSRLHDGLRNIMTSDRRDADVVANYLELLQGFDTLVKQQASRRQTVAFDPSHSCQYSLTLCLEEICAEITRVKPTIPDHNQKGEELISFFAQHANLEWRHVVLSPGFEKNDSGILLAFTKENLYPCVLRWEKTSLIKKGYVAYSPKLEEPFSVSGQEDVLERYAYTFYAKLDQPNLTALSILSFCWPLIRRKVLLLALISLIIAAATLLPSFLLSQMVSVVIPDSHTSLLLQYGSLLFTTLLTSNILNLARSEILLNLQATLSLKLGSALWGRILDQEIPHINRFSSAELFRRSQGLLVIQAIASVQWVVVVIDGLLSLLNVVLMIYYSLLLSVVAFVVGAVVVVSTLIATRVTFRSLVDRSRFFSANIGLTQSLLGMIEALRVSGSEVFAVKKWSRYFSQQQSTDLRISRIADANNILGNSVTSIINVVFLCIAVVGINHYGQKQGIGVGELIGFNSAFGVLLASLVQLSSTVAAQQQQISFYWSELKPVITPPSRMDKVAARQIQPKTLSIRELSFRYPSANYNTLSNINLELNEGEHVALVGRSGSGKTTLVRLLLGFEDLQSGFMGYDGISISRIDLKYLRKKMGIVLQDVELLSGTIGENVSLGLPLAEDEIWNSLEKAAIADFVNDLPLKLKTPVVSGGINFSGGERQRIMIARALCQKPTFLIMDEATSALDNQSQAKVEESIAALRCTRLTIAHRLSTIRSADRIAMLSHGSIVEDGLFNDLVESKGAFFDLISSQIAA